jgi:TetR/AcrR family transcriptional regulator, ethionamide resistance regulator
VSSGVAPRRTLKAEQARMSKGDRREQALLEAAERLLAEGRFADVSVAQLAEEAGISRAGFYFYFASKDVLLASVVDRAVRDFNERIAADLAPDAGTSPAEQLRGSVFAAADLWWQHRTVLLASVELGTALPEVYQRTIDNIAVVAQPTVALLRRHGTVPEADDEEEATQLVMALILMSERNLHHAMRERPSRAQLDALAERLARIWLRAFGLET